MTPVRCNPWVGEAQVYGFLYNTRFLYYRFPIITLLNSTFISTKSHIWGPSIHIYFFSNLISTVATYIVAIIINILWLGCNPKCA